MSFQGSYWIVTLPNEGIPADQVFRKLTASSIQASAQLYKMDVPPLQVGTLNSLMSLSDELVRIDLLVENMVRKIEKQYAEVDGTGEELKIGTLGTKQYVQHFEWDFAKYAVRQRLPQLVQHIQGGIAKIEEEYRNLSTAYSEKTQALQAIKRKRGSNLATTELSDILTEEKLRGLDLIDTEHLVTLVVAVQSTQEKDWVDNYASIGNDIASLGSPDWSNPKVSQGLGTKDGQFGPEFTDRTAVKGSPVVPGSSQKIMEDGDMSLYTVTILKGQYQAGFYDGEQFQPGMYVNYTSEFKRCCKERRFTARDFSFDPEKAGETQREEEKLQLEMQQLHTGMVRWCRAHFGEAFVAWMHLKVVRAFVESVMRYGLPVDFLTVVLAPKKGQEGKVKEALDEMYAHMSKLDIEGGPGADAGDEDEKEEYTAYVCNKFSLLGVK